jgi:predicted Zn-ribbon and HTH transcriptional regulator
MDALEQLRALTGENSFAPKADEFAPVRRECGSCFNFFETTFRWAKQCPACKSTNQPFRKKLIKKYDNSSSPF